MLAIHDQPDCSKRKWFSLLSPLYFIICMLTLVSLPAISLAGNHHPSEYLKSISGSVNDENSNPVPGATVKVRGKSGGTQTDASGRFGIEANENDVLEITAVGYTPAEVVISNASSYTIVLQRAVSEMEQVVVVGYGTQKKVNLTGSVSYIGGAELTKRPVANVQNLLQGKIPGMQVTQSSGKPGDDNAQFRIRGIGTFSSAGSDPLVLIDGVRGDMSNLNPDDVESVSVLKDAASAAIYGARAANGVILVTTKRGKSRDISIQYHGNFLAQKATRLPKLLTNSADYMEYWNQANIRTGLVPYFSQQTIDAFRNNNDPVKYPNFNWVDHIFNPGYGQNHHISVNGGSEKTTFNLSMGFLDQDGIIKIYNTRKYNLLFSVDSKIKDWITIGGNVQLAKKDIRQDNFGDNDYVMSAYSATIRLP